MFSRNRGLLYFPGVTRAEEFGKIAWAALGDDVLDLLVHHIFVAREIIPRAKNADRSGEARAVLHVREQEGVGGPRVMRVVDHEIALGDAVAELDNFDVAIGFSADAFVPATDGDKGCLELQTMMRK